MSSATPFHKALVLALATSTLVACTTINPYTGEQQTSNAVKVGAAGAVICGLIGAGESSKRARNAAAGCGPSVPALVPIWIPRKPSCVSNWQARA